MGQHDYSHLTGEGGKETNLNFLRNQNAQLKNDLQRLQMELAQRAAPTLANFTDTVMLNVNLASQGNEIALQQLLLLMNALRKAEEILNAKAKITVPKIVIPGK